MNGRIISVYGRLIVAIMMMMVYQLISDVIVIRLLGKIGDIFLW